MCAADAFRRVLSSCSACTYMYPGHSVPLAVGNAHVRIESCVAANLVWPNSRPASSLPAYRMRLSKEPVCRACFSPMSRVQLLAFRGRYTTAYSRAS